MWWDKKRNEICKIDVRVANLIVSTTVYDSFCWRQLHSHKKNEMENQTINSILHRCSDTLKINEMQTYWTMKSVHNITTALQNIHIQYIDAHAQLIELEIIDDIV